MDRTKQLFADKILQLAKHKPIKDIQIKELCALCGVERTTFYYHFRDKYELVAWIFKQNYIEEASRAETINDERMIKCKRQVLFPKKRHLIFPKCGKLFSRVCGILFSRIYAAL